jgi:hypothetical protein
MDETAEIVISADNYAVAAFLCYLLIIIGIGVYTGSFLFERH